MKKWEHGQLLCNMNGLAETWHGPSGGKDRPPGTNAVDSMNKLGAEGWQVTGVSDTPNGVRYILSRPIDE